MTLDSFDGFIIGIVLILVIIFSFKLAAHKIDKLKKPYDDIFGI